MPRLVIFQCVYVYFQHEESISRLKNCIVDPDSLRYIEVHAVPSKNGRVGGDFVETGDNNSVWNYKGYGQYFIYRIVVYNPAFSGTFMPMTCILRKVET